MFSDQGVILREVRQTYKEDYDALVGSDLYSALSDRKLLIKHEELNDYPGISGITYKTLKPEQIPFVSYPYEWSFNQLKDAALTTLEIEKTALEYGMTLKDASAFNIQFLRGQPIHIDTLSLQRYREGEPWIAYKQFCQHFLGPLLLMSYKKTWTGAMAQTHLDGLPLELVSSLLPIRTRIKPSVQIHIHLHSKLQQKYGTHPSPKSNRQRSLSMRSRLGLIDNLQSTVNGLHSRSVNSVWRGYYEGDSYSSESIEHKLSSVEKFLKEVQPESIWDLGANEGRFSQLASAMGIPTIAFDSDPWVIDDFYLETRKRKDVNLLPLVMDLANPSPQLGWANRERFGLSQRGPAYMVMALALIHHLAIGNNVPFQMIAEYFRSIAEWALVEFVPRNDPKVTGLLQSRNDEFHQYTQDRFEKAFSLYFEFKAKEPIKQSGRVLYLMKGLNVPSGQNDRTAKD